MAGVLNSMGGVVQASSSAIPGYDLVKPAFDDGRMVRLVDAKMAALVSSGTADDFRRLPPLVEFREALTSGGFFTHQHVQLVVQLLLDLTSVPAAVPLETHRLQALRPARMLVLPLTLCRPSLRLCGRTPHLLPPSNL